MPEFQSFTDLYDTENEDFQSPSFNPAMSTQNQIYANSEENRSVVENAALFVPAVFAKTVDTFVSSLPGVDEEYMEELIDSNFPTIADYIQDNPNAVGLTSDILGSIIPASIAIKAVRTGSVLNKLATRTFGEGANRFFSTGLPNSKLFRPEFRAARRIMKANPGRHDISALTAPSFAGMKRKAIVQSVKDVLIESVAADAAIAATMNSSEFLFPEEMTLTDHLVFFGGTNAVFGIAAGVSAKYTMSRGINELVRRTKVASVNPEKIPVQATSIADNRGAAIMSWQLMADQFRELIKNVPEDAGEEAIATMKANITAAQNQMAKQFKQAASDSTITGITKAIDLNGKQLSTLQAVAADPKNTTAFDGIRSFENFIDQPYHWDNLLTKKVAKDKLKLNGMLERLERAKKTGKQSRAQKLRREIKQLTAEILDNEQTSAYVYELDSTITGSATRKGMFQDGDRTIATLPSKDKFIKLEEGDVLFSKNGGVLLPSKIVGDTQTASPNFTVSSKQVLDSLEVTQKGLIEQLKTPGLTAAIDETEALKTLRSNLPKTFTVFMKSADDSVMSLTKSKEYKIPFTIAPKDIYGLTGQGKLIGRLPNNTNITSETFSKLSFKSMTALQDGQQAVRESLNIETMKNMQVSQGMHHTQLDLVQELVADPTIGAAAYEKVKSDFYVVKNRTEFLNQLQWHSLRSKFEDFQRIQNRNIKLHGYDNYTINDYAKILNLPTNDDRIMHLFQLNRINKDVIDLHHAYDNFEAFEQAVKSLEDVIDPYEGIKFIGQMQNLRRDKVPVVGLLRTTDMPDGVVSRTHLQEKIAQDRQTLLTTMKQSSRPDAQGYSSLIVAKVAQVAEEQKALLEVIKNDAASLTGGTEAGGLVSKVLGTQMFNNRMQSATQAMSRFTDLTDKAVQKEIIEKQIIEKVQPVFRELLKRGNEGDFASFSSGFNSLRAGWYVKIEPKVLVQHPGVGEVGKLPGRKNYQFILEQNATNKELWRARFKTEMPKNALLPISKVDDRPVAVTESAFNALKAVDSIQQRILTEENVLLKAKNQPTITRKSWHMPVPNLEGKSIVYIMDMNDNILQAVPGATPREARNLAQRAAKNYKQEVNIINEDTVAAHVRAKGRIFEDISDLSSPIKQTGPSKGALSSPIITTDPRELKSIIDNMIADLSNIGRRARIELVKPELELAEYQKVASTVGRDVGKTTADTVWDAFRQEALGVQKIDDTSIVGRGLLAIEHGYDRAMQRWFDLRYTEGSQLHPLAKRMAKRQFEDFNDKILPEFNPFKNFNDYLEKTEQITLPNTLRKNAGALNEIVTATAIRIFDVGMGIINLLSLSVTLPPVVKQLQRQAGESADQHLKRVGAYGDVTPKGLAKMNPTKTIISATHWMWNDPEAQTIRKIAAKKGFFDQFAAEQVKLYGRTGEDFVAGHLRNFANKTSQITDRTEVAARAYSFMNFAYIGKKVLGLEDEAAAAFAHFQANNVIGDFRPSNRPLLFQGAAGMPIGLFTTYMWNYLQRMYSMVEARQMPALISQVGLQTAFFGAESVPGVQGFIDNFTANYDGSENLVDRLNNTLGHEATSWFLNGSIASITGISFGPRASVGLPGTRLNPLNSNFYLEAAPAASMISKAAGVVKGTFDNAIEDGGFDPSYAAQLFARSNINKGTANLIELAQGFSEDIRGNLIEDDTRTSVGVAARVLGFKPLMSDEFRQENRRNTATDAKRKALKERLAENLRTHARKGTLTSEVVEDSLGNYIKAGGSPEQFRRFFKSQIIRGTQTKFDKELADALKQSYDENRIARLLAIMEE